MARAPRCSCELLMLAMHPEAEQISGAVKLRGAIPSMAADEFRAEIRGQGALANHCQRICDKASPALPVMLHLRSRYVSKAAILTIPVQPVPVENRSPA